MKRSVFFRGIWLSPLALLRGSETPPNSSSMVDAQTDAALAQVPAPTGDVFNVRAFGAEIDGSTDDKTAIQAAIDLANTNGGGIVFVPSGTGNIGGQLEMKSNVHLIFGVGTYINTGTSSGSFVNFGSGITNAHVSGQGVEATTLKNSGTGTQFGSVVEDRGTDNGIADLTLDANDNTTNTLTTFSTCLRWKMRNIKLIHETTSSNPLNYAWHIRGGNYYDVDGLEIQGGLLAGIQMHADDTYGDCKFGRMTDIHVHDARMNGIDCHALETGNVIEGWTWANIVVENCGQKDVGDDDEFGFYLFGSQTANIQNNTISGLVTTGNKMHGFRMKGRVTRNSVNGLISMGNGGGIVGGDAVSMADGAGSDTPTSNYIQGIARESRVAGNHALSTETNVNLNVYELDIGSDSISLASTKDIHRLTTTIGSSPELCVKVRGSSSMLLLGCLGDLLRFEKREIQVATFAPDRSSP